jgi:heat shock protein HtpX
VALLNHRVGGPAQLVGVLGLGALALCAGSHGARTYRRTAAASLPRSVGRVAVRIRPPRIATAVTAVFALGLPAAAAVALIALEEWGWLAMGGFVLVAGLTLLIRSLRRSKLDYRRDPPRAARALLERLAMRADIPVPELVLEAAATGNAWTTAGRIHITTPLVATLDESELEAVLAHELAHLAHRDAAAMDVCSAPSRMLLGYAGLMMPGFRRWFRVLVGFGSWWGGVWMLLTIFTLPPTLALGWIARLSVLGMSRSREFAADAAAAALTGRPAALASALMKLDEEPRWIPRADLRQAEARAVLCILGSDRSRLGPLFCSHPPTTERVKRLQELEERLQARV